MNRCLLSRVFVFLLVATLLATPATAAGGGFRLDKEPGLFAHLREILHLLVPSIDKARAGMDPDGAPAPTDEGSSSTDLNGQPAAETDARAGIDPDGHS